MSLSIHDASVPVVVRALNSLASVIEKGRLHSEAEKFDQTVFLGTRLYPDMFPLSRQIQVVSDQCKGGIARLAAIEPPKFEDTETTFAELRERINKTVTFVKSIDPKKFEGAESRPLVLTFPNNTLKFKNGTDYLLAFVLPNVYFHSSMAYGILRHCGVKLTKADFIGKLD
jgi:uncharacterized protein